MHILTEFWHFTQCIGFMSKLLNKANYVFSSPHILSGRVCISFLKDMQNVERVVN